MGLGLATVGDIKTVTLLFHTIPSKWNTSRTVHRSIPISPAQVIQLTRWACLTDMSRTRASLFAHGPRIDAFTLPLSSKLRWDTVLLLLF